MLTVFCRYLQKHPSRWFYFAKTLQTGVQSAQGVEARDLQSEHNTHSKHYLRSPYSVIRHHYKDTVTLRKAKTFVTKFSKLRNVEEARLDNLIKLIKEDGYCWEEVELFKEVLFLAPSAYRQRVQLLHDVALSRPSLYHVVWISTVMNYSVSVLRKTRETVFDSDPLESLMSAGRRDLHLSESTIQSALDRYNTCDNVTLKEVYVYLLKHYLSTRFTVDADSVEYVLKSFHSGSLWKPLHLYPIVCEVITDCLGFTFSEVQDQPLLLLLDPKNTKEMLQRFTSIGGTPITELAKTHPGLLRVPVSHLDTWLRLLQKYQVRQFPYTHHTTTLFKTSSFADVEKRLQTLQRLKEWELIVASDRFFEILKFQRHTKRLLNAAESGQVISSLASVIVPKEHTRLNQWHGITPEVMSYVATTLDLPIDQMREVLADVGTPFGISNVKNVLWLLLDYGFTREQIVAGIMVLNFEACVVEQVLRDLHTRPEAQPFAKWMENPFVLHLLAYCIKKDLPHLDLPLKKANTDLVDITLPSSLQKD